MTGEFALAGTVVTLVLPTQRRDTTRMMTAAGITPHTAHVHSGSPELADITGARVPTGIAVTIPGPVAERPRYTSTTGSSHTRRSRSTRTGRAGGAGGPGAGRTDRATQTKTTSRRTGTTT